MGQNSYLALVPLLTSLQADTPEPPTLSDVAQYVFSYLSQTFDDYKVRAGAASRFEAALFGCCPVTRRLSAYHYFLESENGIVVLAHREYSRWRDTDFLYLGDEKDAASSRIENAFNQPSESGRPQSMAPRRVLEDLVRDDDFPTIGGDLQLGLADQLGFRPLFIVRPREVGHPDAFRTYLGRELTDGLLRVGAAFVGGLALP